MATARIALVGALVLITVLSLQPVGPSGGFPHADKLMHALAYAGVAGLAVVAGVRNLVVAVGFATLWGAGVEIGQALMALGREGSWLDGAANLAGAIVGGGLARGLVR